MTAARGAALAGFARIGSAEPAKNLRPEGVIWSAGDAHVAVQDRLGEFAHHRFGRRVKNGERLPSVDDLYPPLPPWIRLALIEALGDVSAVDTGGLVNIEI